VQPNLWLTCVQCLRYGRTSFCSCHELANEDLAESSTRLRSALARRSQAVVSFRCFAAVPGRVHLPERVQAHRAALARWAELFASGQADQFKEHELLHDFLTEIFCGLLGYRCIVDNSGRYTFSRERYVEVDGNTPMR
jgi:hypothetical protein